ncbi:MULTISPECIES: fimbrial protein [Enterobacterales]|uniref:fimbrial protein n=1 Tax=Enterobacterales TaxID=91347 RepID=UPI002ED84A02
MAASIGNRYYSWVVYMKKILLTLAIAGSSVAMASTALGEESAVYPSFDGTVTFNGEIIQTACVIDNASKNLVVPLGKIPVSAFNSSVPTATNAFRKDFSLNLVCPEGFSTPKATVRFDGVPAEGNSKIVQLTADSVATKVGVQLQDAKGEIVTLNDDSSVYDLIEGANNLDFSAYYYPTTSEAPTPGSANAIVNFSIIYQ